MTRADVVVMALAAALVGTLFAAYWQPAQAAGWAEIRAGNALVGRYALTEPRSLRVTGRLGTSVLRIEDGRARFVTSPCRNKVCVHSGWQSHRGDATACLPNRVSLTLLGGAEGHYDAISH